ncbi:uncharacterized protein (TIGR00369 family) [Wenyingzhuangia heitensis]|uniref:Uncharacterized protein (TIGR00369 family) n=1 Tax=Wenyingzhuangia heitensis TaxID=1487859 RepID=A0ABX0UBB9_9FLAO|nr:hotdog fold thioesterase [Wenyingzhuangia heitensis]NIJ46125.1 uncharacterized protein (TIGR00369 family) [Wenyingzhuangia heitensis]
MDLENAIAKLNQISENTLMDTLGIVYTEVGEDYLVGTMPVNERVHQPLGILHGGATAALAESVGSAASYLFVDNQKYIVKGIEISANHIRSKTKGVVTAKATLIHRGNTMHLWQVAVTDERGKLISMCKMTNILLPK